jgi:protein SCO1/2
MSPVTAPKSPALPAEKRRINPWSVWLLVGVMLGGIVVYFSYLKTVANQPYRPGLKARLESNLHLVERSGKAVSLNDLRDKVWLVGQVFTRCPGQCAGMTAEMGKFLTKFGSDPRFQLVSVSLDPEHDTPELLAEFANTHGFKGENWWFVTGEPKEVNDYMRKYFHFAPKRKAEADKDNEMDLFLHDTKVSLVDGGGHIRGWYDLFQPLSVEQLERDIPIVLEEEAKKATAQ